MLATVSPAPGYRVASMDAVDLDPDEMARRSADAMERPTRRAGRPGSGCSRSGPGRARSALTVAARHVNGHGICHGGYVFLLADAAFAYACNSYGVSAVAAGADIDFLRPVPLGAELVAEAVERARSGGPGSTTSRVRVGGEVGGRVPRAGPAGAGSGAAPVVRRASHQCRPVGPGSAPWLRSAVFEGPLICALAPKCGFKGPLICALAPKCAVRGGASRCPRAGFQAPVFGRSCGAGCGPAQAVVCR